MCIIVSPMALTSSALCKRWFGRQFLQTSNVGAFLAHESSTEALGTCLFNISTHTRLTKVLEYNPHPPTRACLTPCVSHHTLTAIRSPFHTTRCWGMWNAWKTPQSFWCRAFLCTKAGLKGLRKDLEWLDGTTDSLDCMEAQLRIEVENETGNYEIHFKWRKSQKENSHFEIHNYLQKIGIVRYSHYYEI